MFKKIVLDNGMRVILVPQKDSLSTTVLVLVEAGSKYETKEINGVSHFLEHMCFKGTKKRPKPIDIAVELDSLGAAYNAFTAQEYTGYYAKVRSNHLDKALDIISDIYLNQIFDSQEIKKEKGVIVEEINMYEDDPKRKIWSIFMELLYGDQPAGWDIAGTKETVRNMRQADFFKYHQDNYVAKATIVVVAGSFNESEALDKVKNYFNGISTAEKISKEKTKESQSQPGIILKYKDTDQTHIVLGTRAFDVFDKRRYVLDILSGVLGGGFSSRLWRKIRDEMGAAYYVGCGDDLYSDHGYLVVPAGIDTSRVDEIISAILGELKRLVSEEIGGKDLDLAKEHLIGDLVLGLETSNSLAGFYGGQEILTKKIITPEQLIEKLKSVSAKEVMDLAQDIFKNEKLNLAIIGPFKEKEKFEEILKF